MIVYRVGQIVVRKEALSNEYDQEFFHCHVIGCFGNGMWSPTIVDLDLACANIHGITIENTTASFHLYKFSRAFTFFHTCTDTD